MLNRSPWKILTVNALLLALTSCGGGGGGGGTATTPPPPNESPTANAGPNQTVEELTGVVLDGSGSNDSDGNITSYQWRQIGGVGVTLSDADQQQASFEAPDVNSGATLRFELEVTDDDGASAVATTLVNVEPPMDTPRHTLGGTISAAEGITVDGDTNDPAADFRDNNSVENAQPIPNPARLGGYVNVAGSGEPGRSTDSGDRDDYFLVDLLEGQTITMLVGDFNRADADLYLMDTEGGILDSSIEVGEIETVTAPSSGTFILNVYAFSGATNYTMAIGTTPSSLAASRPELVAGQAIIQYRDGSAGANLAPKSARGLIDSMGLLHLAGSYHHPYLAGLPEVSLNSQQMQARLRAATSKAPLFRDKTQLARWQTLMTIKTLRQDPAVVRAEPNYILKSRALPDDEALSFQWHYDMINLPAAWELTEGSADIVVAVVDTGVLAGHPDLADKQVTGYDFVRNPGNSGDGDGIDPDPEDNGTSDPGSTGFHGTHVGGTIAAATDNRIGVAGVGWQTRLMSLKALGLDGGTSYDVRQALRYAAGLENDSNTLPEQPAQIINLSIGGGGFSQIEQDLFNELRDLGIIVVASAGNEASNQPSYPAAYANVISVSALDINRDPASYSNFGNSIDVAAPGGDGSTDDVNGDGYPDAVLSTGGSTSDTGTTEFAYVFQAGTSMAAPHVAGVLSLMKAVNPALTPEDIDALLETGEITEDLGNPGRDNRYGHGLINAQKAVAAALAASGNPPADNPRLVAPTSALSFSGSVETREFSLINGGLGELEVLEVSSSEPWLSVAAGDVDQGGLGDYLATVDREGLEPGIYRALITANSSVNTVSVEVTVSVSSSLEPGNVGFIYILLIDASTLEVAAQDQGHRQFGVYSFQFDNVPQGEYEITAGTDADNDFVICDAGEACGAYLTLDSPVQVQVDQDLEGLNFPIDYVIRLPTEDASIDSHSIRRDK